MGIPTGWSHLDAILQGMREGELIVIGARPRVGKSTMAGCLAVNAAKAGRRVLVVSVEMAESELIERFMSAESEVPLQRLRGDTRTETEWQRITYATGALEGRPLTILDDTNATLDKIRACALRVHAELVIVDYVQLMRTVGTRVNREREVAELSSGLKRMARELRVPVVALSQVNRNVESRLDKRPTLADLRESGSIEADANVVLGLYRDELVNEETTEPEVLEVIILKSRNTGAGVVKLRYEGATQRISTISYGRDLSPAWTGYTN